MKSNTRIRPHIILWPNGDIITYQNHEIGIIVSNKQVSEYEFLVLTIDSTDLSLAESILLAQSANRFGRKVVLVPSLNSRREPWFLSSIEQVNILHQVARHSQDDVKTAVLAGRGNANTLIDYEYAAVAYSYNQIITDNDNHTEVHHAEMVLAEFLEVISYNESNSWWLMLLEPCYHCLKDMVASNPEVISYCNNHKDKWNTPEYLALKNSLLTNDKPKYVQEIMVE